MVMAATVEYHRLRLLLAAKVTAGAPRQLLHSIQGWAGPLHSSPMLQLILVPVKWGPAHVSSGQQLRH